MKILIIEDSGLARKMVRSMCRRHFPDAKYVPAKDGLEGLTAYKAALEEAPFDLVFVDQLMPNMDGLEAGQEILKLNPSAYLVMVTANIQASTKKEAEGIGFRQFVNKPISEEGMDQILAQWSKDMDI